MKTMLKLGLAMIVFGFVLAILGSFALRSQSLSKQADKISTAASASTGTSAGDGAAVAAPAKK